MTALPRTQYAVQLIGADELILNTSKEVIGPGRRQILCVVEAVGLCFSDLKLLKLFSSHVRKGEIIGGIDQKVLKEIPSYVPGGAPTVPGHEAVVRIEAVGCEVENFKQGERYLVQTDYRWLRTAGSNAAFGYNFEGALQEYVLMDERVIVSPGGESMLIPVPQRLSCSEAALVEPWACVENSYTSRERRRLKPNGRMLVAADAAIADDIFHNLFKRYGRPAQIMWLSETRPPAKLGAMVKKANEMAGFADNGYDDVIYFGSEAKTVERLFAKLAPRGLFNIVLCGGKIGSDVVTAVGRVHYEGIRIVGTAGFDPAESMEHIPESGEIRPRDRINVIGAGGPMGMMHVIRNICQGSKDISIFAGELDDKRLAALTKIAAPLAKKNGVEYKPYNPTKDKITGTFDYTVLMAPSADLVAGSVDAAGEGGIINIFAGIDVTVAGRINLDDYIEKRLYFVGTSGSVLEDMKEVLAKVAGGWLDTNVCVAAVCGLDGAVEALRAVEGRRIAGKIIVYPPCQGLGLVALEELGEKMPEVAKRLNNGMWSREAEQKLLEMYK